MFDEIVITLDVDWAPDETLAPFLDRLREAGHQATVFATHDSPLLHGLDRNQFEVGIHPNFNNSGGDLVTPIADLTALYPGVRGGRSHSFYNSTPMLHTYADHGLTYESNAFLFKHANLRPTRFSKRLVSVPIYWMDYKQIELDLPFDLDTLALEQPGLKILIWHPMHLFINTTDDTHYQGVKPVYHEVDKLRAHQRKGVAGVGTLFEDLLAYLSKNKIKCRRMIDVAQDFLTLEAALQGS